MATSLCVTNWVGQAHHHDIIRFWFLKTHHLVTRLCEFVQTHRQLIPIFDKPAFSRIYGSQTKILEGRTNRPEHLFDALFKGVSTRFGLRIVEKCVEKMFRTVCSAFQNLRLGSINFLPRPESATFFARHNDQTVEHKMMIACLRVCRNHKMMITCRRVELSVHACRPC